MLKKRLQKITSYLGRSDSNSSEKLKSRLKSSGFFDESWYGKTYPEIKKKRRWKSNPIDHFLEKGAQEGTWPGVWFNSGWYLKHNQDVKKAGINPLIHYLYHGMDEGRFRAENSLINPLLSENQFIRLDDKGITFQVPVFNSNLDFSASFLYQQYQDAQLTKPCGILLIRCLDEKGKPIDEGIKELKWSETYGCWYRYLTQHSTDELKVDKFSFHVTDSTKLLDVTLAGWGKSTFEVRNRFRLSATQNTLASSQSLATLKDQTKKSIKKAKELKVAFIADEFTYNSFKSEFIPIVVEPHNWKEKFEIEKPDVFFCESAWSGVDSINRPWKGKVYASKNFTKENRLELLNIIQYCKQLGIPTLFWNKEDPTHYTDRTHDFVKTASEFDFVFTSAEECVDKYKEDHGLKHVYALPFATNPWLFNPLKTGARSNKVVFAGSWYANHEERSRVMEEILDSLIDAGYLPEIYDRYYGGNDPLHEWPDKYKKYTKPGLPHDQMPQVYKSSLLGLNFNTVTDSSTMFARRVFELMSSNTLVISNHAKGVEEMFGDLVVFADKEPEKLAKLSGEEINSLREAALTKVLREHTYTQRWEYMLDCIGYAVAPSVQTLTLSCLIRSHDEALQAIRYFEGNFGRDKNNKLLLVVSANVSDLELSTFYKKFNRFGVSVTCSSYILRHTETEAYTPIQSDYFLFCDIETLPENQWVEHAKLHLSYMDTYPVATTNATEKYTLSEFSGAGPVLGRADMFSKVHTGFSTGKEITVYEV